MSKFSEVLTIINGKNQSKVENPIGKYPIYGSGGIMGYADEYICKPETVVIGRKGSINKPIYAETHFWNVDTAFGLYADKSKLLPKYLYYFCVNFDFEQLNTTVTIPSLTKANLLNVEIPLTSMCEQHKIVNNLDKVTDLIDKHNLQLQKLDELVKARFVEMFGDPITNSKKLEVKELKDALLLKAGDFTSASDICEEQTDVTPYPCYGGNGIRGYVAEYNQEGEFSLVGRQGALSGNVQFASGKFKNTEHALLVTPIIETNTIWLNQLLLNLELKRYQTGAAQPGLSVKNLQEIPIITPSIELQNQFASFVEKVNKQKEQIQKSLEKVELLKKTLMQKYFG